MANVRGNGAQVDRAVRDVMEAWHRTSEGWRDQARLDFERLHFEELDARARQAVKTISTIEDLLQMAERECT